jgi:hypothetical protein
MKMEKVKKVEKRKKAKMKREKVKKVEKRRRRG